MSEIDLDKIDLTQPPPSVDDEPARQNYFMAKCREYVRTMSEKLGRPLTCATITFGCQMNFRDSEKLLGVLEKAGYASIEDEETADFVIYNTCTIRDNANQKVYGRLGALGAAKRRQPGKRIALCGCMMQEEAVLARLRKSYAFVDLVFGTHNIYKFAELLTACFESRDMVVDIWEGTDTIVENLPVERKYPFKSGVNIMYGCNNFCTYCIVPYVRGRERSRKPEDIIREIRKLADEGVVEVMLLGQNVNSYGKGLIPEDGDEPITFAGLLRRIEEIDGIKRIRFMTSHPKDLSDELIAVMKESKKICRHLHLPLQSGSSRILQAMNRRYTREQYIELAERIRREIPDISLTTDIIVGFPGETRADVEETIEVVKRIRYDNAFTFLYSKRTGTPAAAMDNPVPESEIKEGFDRLLQVVQETARRQCARFQGQEAEVLVEERNEQDPSLLTGRMSNNTLVHFPGDISLVGRLVRVKLTECHGFYYSGSIVEGDLHG